MDDPNDTNYIGGEIVWFLKQENQWWPGIVDDIRGTGLRTIGGKIPISVLGNPLQLDIILCERAMTCRFLSRFEDYSRRNLSEVGFILAVTQGLDLVAEPAPPRIVDGNRTTRMPLDMRSLPVAIERLERFLHRRDEVDELVKDWLKDLPEFQENYLSGVRVVEGPQDGDGSAESLVIVAVFNNCEPLPEKETVIEFYKKFGNLNVEKTRVFPRLNAVLIAYDGEIEDIQIQTALALSVTELKAELAQPFWMRPKQNIEDDNDDDSNILNVINEITAKLDSTATKLNIMMFTKKQERALKKVFNKVLKSVKEAEEKVTEDILSIGQQYLN